jgi:hypothetical protein
MAMGDGVNIAARLEGIAKPGGSSAIRLMQQKRRNLEAVLQRSNEVQALDPRHIYIRTRFACIFALSYVGDNDAGGSCSGHVFNPSHQHRGLILPAASPHFVHDHMAKNTARSTEDEGRASRDADRSCPQFAGQE